MSQQVLGEEWSFANGSDETAGEDQVAGLLHGKGWSHLSGVA